MRERLLFKLRFWPRSHVYVGTWRFGFQFDVQRDNKRDSRGNYSFRGHLWNWDVRRPFRIERAD